MFRLKREKVYVSPAPVHGFRSSIFIYFSAAYNLLLILAHVHTHTGWMAIARTIRT